MTAISSLRCHLVCLLQNVLTFLYVQFVAAYTLMLTSYSKSNSKSKVYLYFVIPSVTCTHRKHQD